jgi:hypothetical protein
MEEMLPDSGKEALPRDDKKSMTESGYLLGVKPQQVAFKKAHCYRDCWYYCCHHHCCQSFALEGQDSV